MALICEIKKVQKERQAVHGTVECSYSSFSEGGSRYLQLDTYGSPDRAIAGKVSQSLQLNHESAKRLLDLIHETFPDLQ